MTMLSQAWATAAPYMLPDGLIREERLEARRLFLSGAYCLLQLQVAAGTLTPAERAIFNEELATELSLFAETMGTCLEGVV